MFERASDSDSDTGSLKMGSVTKNKALDIGRLVAAVLIVFLHLDALKAFPILHFAVDQVLARLGLPFFLLLTGYFALFNAVQEGTSEKVRRWVVAIATTYAIVGSLYVPTMLISTIERHRGVTYVVLTALKSVIVGPEFHLWYVPQAIAGIGVAFFLRIRCKTTSQALIVALSLFSLGVLSSGWQFVLLNYAHVPHKVITVVDLFIRFPIITGPLILFGEVLREWQAEANKRPVGIYWGSILVGLALLYIEVSYCRLHPTVRRQDMYWSMIPVLAGIFWLLGRPEVAASASKSRLDCRFWSSYIYFMHVLPISILRLMGVHCLEALVSFAFCLITGLLVKQTRIKWIFG